MKKQLRHGVYFLLAATLHTGVVECQNLQVNGTFNNDVSGWVFVGGPEVEMVLDGSQGSPAPGSLRLASIQNILNSALFEAHGTCVDVVPGEMLSLEAMILANPRSGSDICFLDIVFFTGPNCTGSRSFSGNLVPPTPGIWELESINASAGGSVVSARASLGLFLTPGAGQTTCNFDTVNLTSSLQMGAIGIPTISWLGHLLVVLILSTVGLVRIRKTRIVEHP